MKFLQTPGTNDKFVLSFWTLREQSSSPSAAVFRIQMIRCVCYVAALCWNDFFKYSLFSQFHSTLQNIRGKMEFFAKLKKVEVTYCSHISTQLGGSCVSLDQLRDGSPACSGSFSLRCEVWGRGQAEGSPPNETMTPPHSCGGPPEEQQEP